MVTYLETEQLPVMAKCTLSTMTIKTVIEKYFSNVVSAANNTETKELRTMK
jgi:hypothetical protein